MYRLEKIAFIVLSFLMLSLLFAFIVSHTLDLYSFPEQLLAICSNRGRVLSIIAENEGFGLMHTRPKIKPSRNCAESFEMLWINKVDICSEFRKSG